MTLIVLHPAAMQRLGIVIYVAIQVLETGGMPYLFIYDADNVMFCDAISGGTKQIAKLNMSPFLVILSYDLRLSHVFYFGLLSCSKALLPVIIVYMLCTFIKYCLV